MKLIVSSRYLSISPVEQDDQFPFLNLIPPHRLGILPLVASTAFHAFASLIFLVVSPYLFMVDPDMVDLHRFHVETLRLTIDEPFYLPIPTHAERVQEAMKHPRPKSPAAEEEGASPSKGSPLASIPDRFELPKPRRAAVSAPVILQPDFDPAAAPPKTATPSLAFWARQAPDLPKPPRKDVTPGRTESASDPAKPAAAPVAAIPNREPVIAEVNVAMPPANTPDAPKLPLPNSATVPVKVRDLAESHAASFESNAGEAVNVMALAREIHVRKVEIPRGFQNVPEPSEARGAASGDERASNTRTAVPPAGADKDSRPKPAPNSTAGAATRPPASKSSPAPASNQNRPTTTSANASPAATSSKPDIRPRVSQETAAATDSSRAPAPPPRPQETPGVTRVNHPVNGNFDVVITQAAAREDLPDLAGMLSGTPVYSVYLVVGDKKEWLLEYCVPAKENAQNNPYMVMIDDVGTVTPPYPISTAVPTSLLGQQIPRHIVVSGQLTAAGDLKISKISEPSSPFVANLLALLNEWRFRPAQRNKRPIDVDIILVIPSRG